MKIDNIDLTVKKKGEILNISIKGSNELKDILRSITPGKEDYFNFGSYKKSAFEDAHKVYRYLNQTMLLRDFKAVTISGHSYGGGVAVGLGVYLNAMHGLSIDMALINPIKVIDKKFNEFLQTKMTITTYIYRNDWLWAIRGFFRFVYAGTVNHTPKPNWKFWTAWGDHVKSIIWGD